MTRTKPDDVAMSEAAGKTSPPGSLSSLAFPNGNTARLITMPPDSLPYVLLEELELSPPKALIIIAGGTKDCDERQKSHLYQFGRGIDRAASGIDAIIIDRGAGSEGMAIMEETAPYRRYNAPIIGIAHAGHVSYPGDPESDRDRPLDPDHSHFILVDEPERNQEIDQVYRFAEFLKMAENIPVITALFNGGKKERAQVLRSVRMESPVIVFKGSGGLADRIAESIENPPDFMEDAELAEIVQEGEIRIFSMESSINALERLIARQVRMDSVLKLAWSQFAVYDLNAIRHQNMFKKTQNGIIWLGVMGTTLALIQSSLKCDGFTVGYLSYPIVVVPIVVSILIAAANEFKSGHKWILLRGSAELIKSHIFRYRTRVETQACRRGREGVWESKLAGKLEQICTHLMETEVNLSALKRYDGPLPPMYGSKPFDDGFSRLSPEQYLETRLEDQLHFYVNKTAKLEKRLRLLEWLVYIVGGVGTALAAFGFELWIALTSALTAAFATHMKYEMLQESLTKYNQAAAALTNIRNWWISLSAAEQSKTTNIDLLLDNTEGILRSEFSSWVQEMQDTIASLQKEVSGKEVSGKEESGKEDDESQEARNPLEGLFHDTKKNGSDEGMNNEQRPQGQNEPWIDIHDPEGRPQRKTEGKRHG